MTNKIYKIKAKEFIPNKYPKTTIHIGSLDDLLKKFSWYLTVGAMQYKSVNKNPKTIRGLISNLNRADKAMNMSRLVHEEFSLVK